MVNQSPITKLEKVIQSYIPKNARCRPDEQKRQYLREQEKNSILQQIEKSNMNPLSIEIDNEWQEIPPDMSTCKVCKEVTYGKQYLLVYKLNGEEIPQDKPVKVCEPCFQKMDK